MSDATPPPNDEIVSAHLDGEASADEAAMVRADPEIEARAAELARVRAAVASPIDAPAAAREAAIAAALDVFDQEVAPTIVAGAAGPPGDGRTAAGVTDLTARRAEAGRRAARNGRILAVAAAVVVVLLGAAGVVRVVTGRSDSQLTAVTPSGGAAPGTAANTFEATDGGTQSKRSGQGATGAEPPTAADAPRSAAPGGDPTTTVTGPPPTTAPSAPDVTQDAAAYVAQAYGYRGADLGAVSNTDQLRAATLTALTEQAAQQQTNESAGTPTPAPGASDAVTLAALTDQLATCDAVLHAADREIGPAAFSAVAQYQGTNALVFVYPIDRRQFPAANGATRLYAVDRATCRVLDSQTP